MARKRATLTDLLNDLTFRVLYDKFKLIAMNAFRWENLPDGILERHIERELFNHGKAIFFRDELMGYMVLECSDTGRQNVYGDPLSYHAIGHGYSKIYGVDDCVIIENNKLRIPTEQFIMFYVNKLAEAERTMDVNIKASKTPVIVLCDDKDVLSFKKLISDVDGNVPAIYADKGLNIDGIKALDTKANFIGNEIMTYKNSVENELLTFLGKNNANTDKRERLITDEANANNQLIESFLELQLEARERACDEINAKYQLEKPVTVTRREVINNGGIESVENPIQPADE